MESWQKRVIQENCRRLYESVICNTVLLAELKTADVLSLADEDQIMATSGNLEKTKLLFKILETRDNAYLSLCKALHTSKQTGALEVLRKEALCKGFPELKIQYGDHVKSLQCICSPCELNELQNIIQDAAGIESLLDAILTSQAKENELKIVKDTIPYALSCYIPRFLSKRIQVSSAIFKHDCSDIFVFKKVDRVRVTDLSKPHITALSSSQLVQPTSRFIILECAEDWNDICKVTTVPVHLIKFDINENGYILEDTFGDPKIINLFLLRQRRHEKFYVSEEDFVVTQQQRSCSGICICDTPGMGKSVLLANLARKISHRYHDKITGFVYLPDFVQSNSINSSVPGLELMLEYISPTTISRIILNELIARSLLKLEIFFDAFDELSADQMKWIENFLKDLTQHPYDIRVYVTSRPHHRKQLETLLGVVSYDILPFNHKNQIEFLVSFWQQRVPSNSSKRKLLEFAEYCLKQVRKTLTQEERDIMGIPFQCFLLASVNLNAATLFANPKRNSAPDSFYSGSSSIHAMFQTFMESRFKKSSTETDLITDVAHNLQQTKSFHVWTALNIICPAIAPIYKQYTNLPEINVKTLLSFGILESQDESNFKSMGFVHRTIAEFLVAEFFVGMLTDKYQDLNFNNTKYIKEFVMFFAQNLLGTNNLEGKRLNYNRYFAHPYLPVSTFDLPVVLYFVNAFLHQSQGFQFDELVVNIFIGALEPSQLCNVLQCACHHNYLSIFTFVRELLEATPKSQNFKDFFLQDTISLISILPKPEFSNPATLLMSVIAEFSNAQMMTECFKLFYNCFEYDLDKVCQSMDKRIRTPLHRAVKRANYELVENLLGKITLYDRSLLHWCVSNTSDDDRETIKKRIEICKLLLKNSGSYCKDNGNHMSPLIAEQVHLELIKFLICEGENPCAAFQKETVVHRAATYMSSEDFYNLCQFLIEDRRVFILFEEFADKWVGTIHHILRWGKNITPDVIKLILAIPSVSTNELTEDKNTVFMSAVLGEKSVNVLKALVEHGVNTNDVNNYGQNALHCAVEVANVEVVEYLLSLNFDIDHMDKNGNTAITLARNNLKTYSGSDSPFLSEQANRLEKIVLLLQKATQQKPTVGIGVISRILVSIQQKLGRIRQRKDI